MKAFQSEKFENNSTLIFSLANKPDEDFSLKIKSPNLLSIKNYPTNGDLKICFSSLHHPLRGFISHDAKCKIKNKKWKFQKNDLKCKMEKKISKTLLLNGHMSSAHEPWKGSTKKFSEIFCWKIVFAEYQISHTITLYHQLL